MDPLTLRANGYGKKTKDCENLFEVHGDPPRGREL
jgi:hypothetical protein